MVVHNDLKSVFFELLYRQGGPWSESLEAVSGANIPDPPAQPTIICNRSPSVAQITWAEPAGNGANIIEYRLEWQQRNDTEFSLVCYFH